MTRVKLSELSKASSFNFKLNKVVLWLHGLLRKGLTMTFFYVKRAEVL